MSQTIFNKKKYQRKQMLSEFRSEEAIWIVLAGISVFATLLILYVQVLEYYPMIMGQSITVPYTATSSSIHVTVNEKNITVHLENFPYTKGDTLTLYYIEGKEHLLAPLTHPMYFIVMYGIFIPLGIISFRKLIRSYQAMKKDYYI